MKETAAGFWERANQAFRTMLKEWANRTPIMSYLNSPRRFSRRWSQTGLWALTAAWLLTAWSTLEPQPDQAKDRRSHLLPRGPGHSWRPAPSYSSYWGSSPGKRRHEAGQAEGGVATIMSDDLLNVEDKPRPGLVNFKA